MYNYVGDYSLFFLSLNESPSKKGENVKILYFDVFLTDISFNTSFVQIDERRFFKINFLIPEKILQLEYGKRLILTTSTYLIKSELR